MPAPSLFDSAWLKWGRAVTHADALDREIGAFAAHSQNHQGIRLAQRYDPRRHGFSIAVEEAAPLPPWWTLMLGDVVGNFRSCLDHVAWALVTRGRTPNLSDQKARAVYFPIARDSAHFTQMVKTKLPGVRRSDLAIVRRNQPYQRGATRVKWHCFTVLDRLASNDKHREIQGIWMVPDSAVCEIAQTWDCEDVRAPPRGRRGLLEVGTEVTFIRARKSGPNPRIAMSYRFTTYPAFDKSLWLQHWMDITQVTIMMLLDEFAQPPEVLDHLKMNADRFKAAQERWMANAKLWADVAGKRKVPGLRTFSP